MLVFCATPAGAVDCCSDAGLHELLAWQHGIHDAEGCVVKLPGVLADAACCSEGAIPCSAWHYQLNMLHACLQALMPLIWQPPSMKPFLLAHKVGEPSWRDFECLCPARVIEKTPSLITGQAVAIAISEAIVNTTSGTAGAV